MRTSTKLFILGILLFVTISHAHAMRMEDGSLIKPGDPVAKLARYLGHPIYRSSAKVCTQPVSTSCRGEQRWGHQFQYYYDNRNWIIDVYQGTITRMEWSR